LPKFFHDDHVRVLKILSSIVAHLKLLHHDAEELLPAALPHLNPDREKGEQPDCHAVVIMAFEVQDSYGRRAPMDKESVGEIRMRLQNTLEPRESVLFYRDKELIVMMPGISSEELPRRVRWINEIFERWKMDRVEAHKNAKINLGYSVCEEGEDLSRTLEIASLVMHPED
jgi:hypothetical protein